MSWTVAPGGGVVSGKGRKIKNKETVYTTIELLGKGTYGEVWTVSTNDDQTPTHIMKIFFGDQSLVTENTQREYEISQILKMFSSGQTDKPVCTTYAVCANVIFFARLDNEFRGFLVFPEDNTRDLLKYVRNELYKNASPQTMKSVQLELLEISRQMCLAVQALHSLGVIHADVKPSNMLYNPQAKTIRLIDFGISCTTLVESGLQPLLNFSQRTWCGEGQYDAIYTTTDWYRDPRSGGLDRRNPYIDPHYQQFKDWVELDEKTFIPGTDGTGNVVFPLEYVAFLWPLFDTFAVAVCVYQLFRGKMPASGPAYVNDTPYTPKGKIGESLLLILREMTSSIYHRAPLGNYANQFRFLKRFYEEFGELNV